MQTPEEQEGRGSVTASCTRSRTHAIKLSSGHQHPRRSAGTFYMMDLESNLLLGERLVRHPHVAKMERLKEHANITAGKITPVLQQSFHKTGTLERDRRWIMKRTALNRCCSFGCTREQIAPNVKLL